MKNRKTRKTEIKKKEENKTTCKRHMHANKQLLPKNSTNIKGKIKQRKKNTPSLKRQIKTEQK